jgi:hypothetical protein
MSLAAKKALQVSSLSAGVCLRCTLSAADTPEVKQESDCLPNLRPTMWVILRTTGSLSDCRRSKSSWVPKVMALEKSG